MFIGSQYLPVRHNGVSRYPSPPRSWIPAGAGMTEAKDAQFRSIEFYQFQTE